MHVVKFRQRALILLSLIITVEAAVFSGELRAVSHKHNTAPSKRWHSGIFARANSTWRGHPLNLTDWFNRTDNQWYLDIKMGTPAQNITVLVETMSVPLLVPAGNSTALTRYKFHPDNSTTFKPGNGNATKYEFGTGFDTTPLSQPATARCRLNNDTVSLGGKLNVSSQSFLLCDEYDSAFNAMPIAGILGLDTYQPGAPARSLFWNLWESGKLDNPIFSLFLPSGGIKSGRLTMGGMDQTKYSGDIRYVHLHLDSDGGTGGRWMAEQAAVFADGRLLGNASDGAAAGYALLDTGTAFVQAPDRATAAALYAQLSPEFELLDRAGAWGAPCAAMAGLAPVLTFRLGAGLETHNYTIGARTFNLGEYPTRKGYCQGLFNSPARPMRAPDGKPVWVLGSPFLKSFYTVWNGLEKKVGFADLVGTDQSRPLPSSDVSP